MHEQVVPNLPGSAIIPLTGERGRTPHVNPPYVENRLGDGSQAQVAALEPLPRHLD